MYDTTGCPLHLCAAPQFAAPPRKSINAFRLAVKSSGRIVSMVGQMGESPPASYCNNKQFVFVKWREA
jgi:hypothetical protein